MRVVLVTDRRLVPADELPARIAAILATVPRGSVAIQVREKDLDGGALLALTRNIVAVARPAGAPVFVNDRIDIALAAGADGVHLPERGLSLPAARSFGLRVGCSRHTVEDAVAVAAQADVVQLGPFGIVPGKGEPLPLTALTRARAALPATTTLVAVGGIDSPQRAAELRAAGADAVAIIRAAWRLNADIASIVSA